MARIRSIKPSIWIDERFIGLSREARLLCIGMISHADDEGRLLATAVRLAGDIFPADDLKPAQVLKWRTEIQQAGLIEVYEVSVGCSTHCFRGGASISGSPSRSPAHCPARTGARLARATRQRSIPHRSVERFRARAHPSRAEAPTSRRQE